MATLKARAGETPWGAADMAQFPARAERSRLTEKIEAMAEAVRRQETTYQGEGPAHDLEAEIRAINARIEQLTHSSGQTAPDGRGGQDDINGMAATLIADADRTLDLRSIAREAPPFTGHPNSYAGATDQMPHQIGSRAQDETKGRVKSGVKSGAAAARHQQAGHANGNQGSASKPDQSANGASPVAASARTTPTRRRRGQERVPELRSLRNEDEHTGRTVPLLAFLIGGAAILGGLYYSYGDAGVAEFRITHAALTGSASSPDSANEPVAINILDTGKLTNPSGGLSEPLGTRFAVAGIEGEAGSELAIQITLPRGDLAPESLLLIRGIPAGSSVSPAEQVDKDWAVRLEDIDNLYLQTPAELRGWFPFEVVLQRNGSAMPETRIASIEIFAPGGVDLSRKDDGEEDEKTLFPNATPKRPPISAEMEGLMMERGEALMRNGDVAGARLAFQHLALRGSGRGAMALGKTFDPSQLALTDIRGMAPDPEQAAEWYQKAIELGVAEGQAALQALNR